MRGFIREPFLSSKLMPFRVINVWDLYMRDEIDMLYKYNLYYYCPSGDVNEISKSNQDAKASKVRMH